jgi:quinol monooxygenase YgiN
MSQLTIIGTITVQSGFREEVLRAALAHRERCLRDEPGTLKFDVLVPEKEADQIVLYEVYSSSEAFLAHWNGPSLAQVRAEVGDRMLSITGIRCSSAGE